MRRDKIGLLVEHFCFILVCRQDSVEKEPVWQGVAKPGKWNS